MALWAHIAVDLEDWEKELLLLSRRGLSLVLRAEVFLLVINSLQGTLLVHLEVTFMLTLRSLALEAVVDILNIRRIFGYFHELRVESVETHFGTNVRLVLFVVFVRELALILRLANETVELRV